METEAGGFVLGKDRRKQERIYGSPILLTSNTVIRCPLSNNWKRG